MGATLLFRARLKLKRAEIRRGRTRDAAVAKSNENIMKSKSPQK
jgi:hypothetical protein